MRLIPLLLLLFCTLAGADEARFDKLTAQQVHASLPQLVLVDVRSPEEFAEGHVPGAVNLPHDAVTDYLHLLQGQQQRHLVLYCRSGRRAGLAAAQLQQQGFQQISLLEGDMPGWQEQGFQVQK